MLRAMNTATLGLRIRELRRSRRLTHSMLAEKVGISRSYVTRLESGRIDLPSKRVLWSLAKTLSVTTGDLLAAAGYLPSWEQVNTLSGIEIAFMYVATLPEDTQRQVLDFVARISLYHDQRLREQDTGRSLDHPAESADHAEDAVSIPS